MLRVSSEMIQRIDANTEDVVDNVQGAQRELMKYWSRVSGNRWLVAKMFGVLMVCFVGMLQNTKSANIDPDLLSVVGPYCGITSGHSGRFGLYILVTQRCQTGAPLIYYNSLIVSHDGAVDLSSRMTHPSSELGIDLDAG